MSLNRKIIASKTAHHAPHWPLILMIVAAFVSGIIVAFWAQGMFQ